MHRSRDAGTWNSIRAAGREEAKNPPCQSARRVSECLLRNSKSSLAVFYVEQVALNRHVSPQPQLYSLCLSWLLMSRVVFLARIEAAAYSLPIGAQHAAPLQQTPYSCTNFKSSSLRAARTLSGFVDRRSASRGSAPEENRSWRQRWPSRCARGARLAGQRG